MILFTKDWEKYPTAIVHTATKNESWLTLAAKFKAMGIENAYFHLALLQPDLAGVDPHDPDLTEEQKIKITLEVENNPWYFFREIIAIEANGLRKPLVANRGIIAALWCFFVGIRTALIMPRQEGKSFIADCLKIYLLTFTYENQEIYLFTKDAELRKKNVQKLKDIRDGLPPYLYRYSKKDLDNTEAFSCRQKNNLLRIGVGQSSKKNAEKIGRGHTLPAIFIDEGPFINNVQVSIGVLNMAYRRGEEIAEEVGKPHGIMHTTTAGKLDTVEGKYMYNLIHNGMYMSESLLYDQPNKLEAREAVRKNSAKGACFVNCTYSHKQLGRPDSWVTTMATENDLSQEEIDRDLLNIWTSGSLSSPLDLGVIKAIASSEIDPLHTTCTGDNYLIKWYIPEHTREQYMNSTYFVAGLDTSNAVGGDPNALVICDVRTMEIVATVSVAETNLIKYAIWLAKFLIRYQNIILVPENKSSGQTILDVIYPMLEDVGIDPYKRIFSRVVDQHKEMVTEFAELEKPLMRRNYTIVERLRKYFGFQTSGASRSLLYDTVLLEATGSSGHLVRDVRLADELKGLVRKNGRIDHPEGGHDDSVIAWLLCHWFVRYAKNLSFYGLKPGTTLSLVTSDGATLTDEQLLTRRELVKVTEQIEEVKDRLQAAPSILEMMRYEKTLAGLVSKAQMLGETSFSYDSIMNEIKKNRVTRNDIRSGVRKLQARQQRSAA